MKITFLGSGTALSKKRGWSSILIEDRILVDPSPDVTHRLRDLGISVGDLECVLVSHFHADHYFGLPFLQLERHYFYPELPALPLAGPKGLRNRVCDLLTMAYEDVPRSDPGIVGTFEYFEYVAHRTMSVGHLEVTPYPVVHNNLDAYGLQLRIDDRLVAYTGDTGFCPQLCRLVKGTNILIAEMSHVERESPEHLNLSQVIHLRDKMGTSAPVVIATHLGDEEPEAQNILFAADLAVFEV